MTQQVKHGAGNQIFVMIERLEAKLKRSRRENKELMMRLKEQQKIIVRQSNQIKRLKQNEVIDVANVILPLEESEAVVASVESETVVATMESEIQDVVQLAHEDIAPLEVKADEEQVKVSKSSEAFWKEWDKEPSLALTPSADLIPSRSEKIKSRLGTFFDRLTAPTARKQSSFSHLSKQFN